VPESIAFAHSFVSIGIERRKKSRKKKGPRSNKKNNQNETNQLEVDFKESNGSNQRIGPRRTILSPNNSR